MQGRSRMAAWMLAAVAVGAGCGLGGWAGSARAGQPTPVRQKVKLDIQVAGTTRNSGAEVVIKPGSPACKFKPVTCPIKQDGTTPTLPTIEVETLSAERDCSFAIVLKEPGQPDKLFRRSLQLDPPAQAEGKDPQILRCYISSPLVTAKVAGQAAPAVATKPIPEPVKKR